MPGIISIELTWVPDDEDCKSKQRAALQTAFENSAYFSPERTRKWQAIYIDDDDDPYTAGWWTDVTECLRCIVSKEFGGHMAPGPATDKPYRTVHIDSAELFNVVNGELESRCEFQGKDGDATVKGFVSIEYSWRPAVRLTDIEQPKPGDSVDCSRPAKT